MNRSANARMLSLLVLVAGTTACSGGSSSGDSRTGGNFTVLSTEPLNNGRLFLNDPIRFDFSNPVDLSTADLTTVSFQVFDQNGNALQEQPTGTFELGTSPGDTQPGRRLLFVPRFPTNDTYDNGGFRPGRTYLVNLVGGDRRNETVLRDANGKGLLAPQTFTFTTAEGTSPAQLFRNPKAGGPRRVGFEIVPEPDAQNPGVSLNKLGAPPVEVRLLFDQPVNPNSANIPVGLDTNPLVRNINNRGRVFLEYDDPEFGDRTWIPAAVDLERNSIDGAIVVLRPVGVLPNNAEIRVIVENTFEDISGESNVANAAYNRVFATFVTRPDYEPQFDALVEEFRTAELIDFNAPYLEPQAEYETGVLRASFDFEGTQTTLDYEPRAQEVRLNTDFTQIVPANGVPFNVSGGVFNFRNVTIPANVIVRGEGTRPMVWLVSGEFKVAGTLTVRGGDGDRVNVLNSANFPTAGGPGTCGGGAGGRGSPFGTQRSMQGETGFGPGNRPGGGGRPGLISCQGGCGRGSGGGGGALSTQGDPFYKRQAGAGTSFQQQVGIGGQGCNGASGAAQRVLAGGPSAPIQFVDSRVENNFWGTGVDVNRQIRISGELAAPIGGSGGGGGGDLSNSAGCDPNAVNFINDSKGGGGGGGGGVLVVKALGRIVVEPGGNINADGGHGGGGEQAGSCNQGGGGGSGSGGMVVLMSATGIDIHAQGSAQRVTYADNDYDFAVSAEGGVCLTGSFSTPNISGKYPASGQLPVTGEVYDGKPLGAFGGMGLVQLMAPPGDPTGPNVDGTNTVLDDNIRVFGFTGQQTQGQDKIDLLAWRGFPNANGVFVDDNGIETNIGADEGDIRPSPILLPVPFNSKTRARSEWIDIGFAQRRALIAPDSLPRGIVEETGNPPLPSRLAGPTYQFAGIETAGDTAGYIDYAVEISSSVRPLFPIPDELDPTPMAIASLASGQDEVDGAPAHRVDLVDGLRVAGTGQPFGVADFFVHHEAELYESNNPDPVATFRILSHTDRRLLLAADQTLPLDAETVLIRKKFFQVFVDGSEEVGSYPSAGGVRRPFANLRIGFAFHQDPADPLATRYPADPTEFVYDLEDPTVQETIRQLGATYVQWDVLFDSKFEINPGENPVPFGPSSPRPELRFLRLPFRF